MVWGSMFQVLGFRLNSIGLEVEVSGELQVIGTRSDDGSKGSSRVAVKSAKVM